MKPTTKQILNFIHNTLGVTKEEFKQAALDAAKAEGEREARRLIQQDKAMFEKIIISAIDNLFKYNSIQFNENHLNKEIIKTIAKGVADKVDIKVTKK